MITVIWACYSFGVSDRGVLVIVSSPSGAGKTTLTRRLLAEFGPSLEFSVSYTTRPMRTGEVDGRDYWFVSPESSRSMVERGEFAEHAYVFTEPLRHGAGADRARARRAAAT